MCDMEKIRDQLHRASCIVGLLRRVADDEIEMQSVLLAETLGAAEDLILAANSSILEKLHPVTQAS